MSEILVNQPWKSNNGGRRYLGHIAVGADADVNGTGPVNSALQDIYGVQTDNSVLGIQEIMTGTPPFFNNGLMVKAVSNYDSPPTTLVGIEALATTAAGNVQGAGIVAGFFGAVAHRGTGTVLAAYGLPGVVKLASAGTITLASGLYGNIQNAGAGTITTAYGALISTATNTGGGAITTNYGLYLEAQSAGTTDYNLYSAGLASRNYFDGYVETASSGGFYLGTTGSVNNRFLLNAPTASDSTAEQINTPSSTARKALVLQGYSSGQAANLFEIQQHDGTLLANIRGYGALAAYLELRGVAGEGNGSGINFYSNAGGYTGLFSLDGSGNMVFRNTNTAKGTYYDYASSGGAYWRRGGGASTVLTLGDNGAALFQNSTNSTTAFQIQNAAGTTTLLTADTTNNQLTLGDATNIAVNTTTGTKIGTATTQKLAFYNATPVVQQTELTDELTTITHTAPGTPDYAIQDLTNIAPYGFVTQDEGNTVLSVIANLQTRVNELENKLVAYGLLPDAD